MPDTNTLDALAEALSASLSSANLVPGPAQALVPPDFKPTTRLSISFDGKDVELGNLFRVSEVKLAPFVSFEAEVSPLSIHPSIHPFRYRAASASVFHVFYLPKPS
jgi:hypothetical protein